MEELSYTSKYDGKTTDDILGYANEGKVGQINEKVAGYEKSGIKSYVDGMKAQSTVEDGETVQVYDTDGLPHKIAKAELLKKSTLALPKLEDISSFVAINAAGNAVGVMTKEQVSEILGKLLEINNYIRQKKTLVSGNADDYKDIGIYDFQQNSPTFTNIPLNFGTMIVYGGGTDYGYKTQLVSSIESGESYIRTLYGGSWSPWKKITP